MRGEYVSCLRAAGGCQSYFQKKKKSEVVAVFRSPENEVPTARGKELRSRFETNWQRGHEK